MKASQLQSNEYSSYYGNYIEQAGDLELVKGLEDNLKSIQSFYTSISEKKYNYSYDEGKWTVKEILQHLIDAERVFAYRALRIARNDKVNLLGFSQDDFVLTSHSNLRTKVDLIEEFVSVRKSTISLFRSFRNEMLLEVGKASDSPVSVRAIGFIIIGHEVHHTKIIRERYL